MSRALITPNVCHLGAAALTHVPVGHAMGDDGKAYDLVGFFSQHLAHAVARHVHDAGAEPATQLAVFAAACIEMMRPLVPDLAQRAHELCFPDDIYETHTSVGVPEREPERQIELTLKSPLLPISSIQSALSEVSTQLAQADQDLSAWLSPSGKYLQETPPLQNLRDAGLRESITEDGEPRVLGHTLCFAYRGHSYSLHDQPDYFGVGDVVHVLPAAAGDAVWVAIEDTATFGTYACCVQPIQMKEGASHV